MSRTIRRGLALALRLLARGLDPGATIRPVSPLPAEPPPEPGGRYSVTVNKPRRGRDRGEWRLRIARPDGTDTHELSGVAWCPETLGQAEHQARIREAELNGETPPPAQPDGLTVGQILDRYVEWCEANQAPGTARFSRNAARHAHLSGLAEVASDRVGKRDLSDYRDHLFRECKGNTAAGYMRRLYLAWEWALEKELVEETLPRVRRRRLGPGDRTQKRALTDKEAVDLLEFARTYAGGRYHLILWANAETASRISELGGLEVQDFSWDGQGHAARLRFTQKGGSHRYNWVSPPLAEAIHRDAIAGRTSGPIWSSARGGLIRDSTLEPLMTRWKRERNLVGQVDTHSLRRYGVARLENRGVSQAEGMKVTGHTSAEIYARYAAKGHYDLLAACSALWLDDVSTVSTGGATLPAEVLQRGSVDWPTRIRTYNPGAVDPAGVGHVSCPCTPLLIDFLRVREGRIVEARQALDRSLQAVRA